MTEDAPLTVLIVYGQPDFWSMGEGKGTVSFLRTIEGLTKRGHRVHVSLPGRPDQASPSSKDAPEIYHGAHLHRSPPPSRLIPRAALPLLRRLWERWRCWKTYQAWAEGSALALGQDIRPDLVVGLGAFEVPVAYAVAQKLGVPNVSRLFGTWSLLADPLRYRLNFPERRAFQTPTSALIVTNDGSPGDRMAAREGVAPEKMFFLRNGLSFDHFHPGPPSPAVRRRLELRADQPLILVASRHSFEKKLDRSIRAFADYRAQGGNGILALAGDGEERGLLEALAAELGLQSSVRFPGAIARQELPEWYRTADLVLSLLDRTNISNPCFEAMACGAVYVALETPTTHDLIDDRRTGMIVSRDELEGLGEQLIEWIGQPGLLQEIGTEAARAIREKLVTPHERLGFEMDLYEAVACHQTLPDSHLP